MKVIIKHGLNTLDKDFPAGTTVADIRNDQSLKAVIGVGDNINILQNGVALEDDVELSEGQTIKIETAANQKA